MGAVISVVSVVLQMIFLPGGSEGENSGEDGDYGLHYGMRSKEHLPYVDVNKIVTVNSYDRPAPTKEDTIVFMKKGRVKLGFVQLSIRKYMKHPNFKSTTGVFLNIDSIPNLTFEKRLAEEAMVVDRCFSLGETVVRYENAHPDDPAKRQFRKAKATMIGQVLDMRESADLLLLPHKTAIVTDVPMEGVTMMEKISPHNSHNYILYEDWIGDVRSIEQELTLLYKGQRLTVWIGKSGIATIRVDPSDEDKCLVPGEHVRVSIYDAFSKSAKWDGDPPALLKRRFRRCSRNDDIVCVVEKVVACSANVYWITSPSSIAHPSTTLNKEQIEKVIPIDLAVIPHVNSADRLTVDLGREYETMTKKAYNQKLHDTYSKYFVKTSLRPQAKKPKTEESAEDADGEMKEEEEEKEARVAEKTEDFRMEEGDANMEESDDEEEKEDEREAAKKEPTPPVTIKTTAIKMHSGRLKRQRKTQTRRVTRRAAPRPPTKSVVSGNICGEVLYTRTLVDVEWMDGRIERNIPGYQLVPVDPDLDQQDHLPGTLVAKKSDETTHDDKFGVIIHTDPVERTCLVRWFSIRLDSADMGGALIGDEQCTLFDIMPHPSYQRHLLGNLGVCMGRESEDVKNVLFQVIKNLDNGKQEVKFFSGETAQLWPTQMTPVFKGEDEESVYNPDEHSSNYSEDEYDDEEEYEAGLPYRQTSCPDHLKQALLQLKNTNGKTKAIEDFCDYLSKSPLLNMAGPSEDPSRQAGPSSHADLMKMFSEIEETAKSLFDHVKVENANRTLSDLALEEFAKLRKTLCPSTDACSQCSSSQTTMAVLSSSWAADDESLGGMPSTSRSVDETTNEEEKMDTTEVDVEMEETEPETTIVEEENEPKREEELGTFKMTATCTQNTYATYTYVSTNKWVKAVLREHRMLSKHLPAGVHVCAYEDRMDLMKFIIIGPRGTPFELTPFHFDLRLPGDFPHSPPEVNYLAHSQEQLNPNLYQTGKVCTSLLGTWSGQGIETWTENSNLQQVFLSIQGLILNAEPYFNEAGYESRKEKGEMSDNSKRYNETVAINSLEYMWKIYDSPPDVFKDLIRCTVRQGFPELRAQMHKWIEGKAVPAYPVHMSKGFLLSLGKSLEKMEQIIAKHQKEE